ncbi:MAG TPA: hypothetical protein VM536_22630 [Chloroflexia bacterium]|nr:hypothetical protein [Chloroflexia bacterium]
MVVVGVVLAMCLASTAVCVVSPLVLPRLPLPFGYMMSVCGFYTTTPRTRMGVYWISPFISSVHPLATASGQPCTVIPWLPALPQRGDFSFPP